MSEAVETANLNVRPTGGRTKFIVGGLILLAAVAYLIVSNLATQQEYFMTVNELMERQGELAGPAQHEVAPRRPPMGNIGVKEPTSQGPQSVDRQDPERPEWEDACLC